MRYLKISGLLVIAAMALTGSASASTLTAPAGTHYTSTISASNSGGITFHGPADATCNTSTLQGKNASHGAGVTIKGTFSAVAVSNCNQHWVIKISGSFEIHGLSGNKGRFTVTGLSFSIEYTTIFGNIHCVYGTNNTDMGTITGAGSGTGHATLSIDSAPIPVTSGGGLCGSSGEWTGSYKINSPTGLTIDQ